MKLTRLEEAILISCIMYILISVIAYVFSTSEWTKGNAIGISFSAIGILLSFVINYFKKG